ncbi:NAD(P)H-binding protein [Kitasatospora sp. YST-16]|uniref:NAD(P)H-binding protein n=1 Tax=unclassified Kitasatospora TaxID=2633591 RepID=UPI0004C37414|nr:MULTISPECIES: NAD(P)H-binding protein [unclassified Kitasatospora]WAL76078.1 NAD(P)H-binding protein [Kitasatospora sp. YST-16]WNW42131.1 NAD(P)H-binding protein [Streptomyces sp. Li-HN-5-13]
MILLTGATGSIGRHLVRRLAARGAEFRALVRDEAKGRALGCAYTVGDFADPGSLAAAFDGVDRLFLNGPGAVPVDGEQPMLRQLGAVIDAAAAAGVERVVKVSVRHAAPGRPLSEGVHGALDRRLAASGPAAWTLLQPSGFLQNLLAPGTFTPDGRLVGRYGGAPVSHIDCRDIADCAEVLLTGPPRPGESFALTGPEAVTDRQLADRVSRALHHPVGLLPRTPDEVAADLTAQGAPAGFAAELAVLLHEVAAGSLAEVTTAVPDLLGRPARTVDAFLTDHLPAFRTALRLP